MDESTKVFDTLPPGWTVQQLGPSVEDVLANAQPLLAYIVRVRRLVYGLPVASADEQVAEIRLRQMVEGVFAQQQCECGSWNNSKPFQMIGDEQLHVAKFCGGCGKPLADAGAAAESAESPGRIELPPGTSDDYTISFRAPVDFGVFGADQPIQVGYGGHPIGSPAASMSAQEARLRGETVGQQCGKCLRHEVFPAAKGGGQ